MCFNVLLPPTPTPEPSLAVIPRYKDLLQFLGFRFPEPPSPALVYKNPVARTVCHEWLLEATEVWVPRLATTTVTTVQYMTLTDLSDVLSFVTPSALPGTERALQMSLVKALNGIRALYEAAPSAQLGAVVREILRLWPPSPAYLWLIAHNLVPVRQYYRQDTVVLVATRLLSGAPPDLLTRYVEEEGFK